MNTQIDNFVKTLKRVSRSVHLAPTHTKVTLDNLTHNNNRQTANIKRRIDKVRYAQRNSNSNGELVNMPVTSDALNSVKYYILLLTSHALKSAKICHILVHSMKI